MLTVLVTFINEHKSPRTGDSKKQKKKLTSASELQASPVLTLVSKGQKCVRVLILQACLGLPLALV